MKFQCFDVGGELTQEGFWPEEEPDVHTYGSISFQVNERLWLSILTSEWLTVYSGDHPKHYGNS